MATIVRGDVSRVGVSSVAEPLTIALWMKNYMLFVDIDDKWRFGGL